MCAVQQFEIRHSLTEQILEALAVASVSISASTKIKTVVLATFVSTISGVQYFDSNPLYFQIFMKIATCMDDLQILCPFF